LINSLRNIGSNTDQSAPVSSSMIDCTVKTSIYHWKNDIYLIDTPGFLSPNNKNDKNVQDFDSYLENLKKIFKEESIEVPPISGVVFVSNDRFVSNDERLTFKNLEDKPILVFFVRNKFDSLLKGIIDDYKDHQNGNTDENPKELKYLSRKKARELKIDMKKTLINISQFVAENSSYLITGTKAKFTDQIWSPDGSRFKAELELITKLNAYEPINLEDRNSLKLIHYKTNSLKALNWLNITRKAQEASKLLYVLTLKSFWESFSNYELVSKHNYFLKQYGIYDIIAKFKNDETYFSYKKSNKLAFIIKRLESEEEIWNFTLFQKLFTGKENDRNNVYTRFKQFFNINISDEMLLLIVKGVSVINISSPVDKQILFRSSPKNVPVLGKYSYLIAIPILLIIIYVITKTIDKMLEIAESTATNIYEILQEPDELGEEDEDDFLFI
jgi:GTP-binding protein EngB required for normal cell division